MAVWAANFQAHRTHARANQPPRTDGGCDRVMSPDLLRIPQFELAGIEDRMTRPPPFEIMIAVALLGMQLVPAARATRSRTHHTLATAQFRLTDRAQTRLGYTLNRFGAALNRPATRFPGADYVNFAFRKVNIPT